MSLLTVVGNPRRRARRGRRRRPLSRRKSAVRARSKRRRARGFVANPRPRRHRRVHARRHRRSNPRRHRRHRNPISRGSLTTNLFKGLGVGTGIYLAEVGTAALNAYVMAKNPLTGLPKTGVKAAVALIGLPLLLKALPLPGKIKDSLIHGALLGGGAIVALDLLHQYATPMLPAEMHDGDTLKGYEYGSLSAYSQGQLSGWAPQGNISGWAPQDGVSGSDDMTYGGGAY